MPQITITNVTKISPTQYSVEFLDDFDATDLFYEVSLDGSTWQEPISLTSFTSPQTITVENAINFNLRLSSNYTAPYSRIHTSVFSVPFN